MVRSDYEVVRVTPEIVFIDDLCDGRMSVTNDAENVVREVAKSFPGRRVVYRDSDGNWDELLHAGGRFTGFCPYNGETP